LAFIYSHLFIPKQTNLRGTAKPHIRQNFGKLPARFPRLTRVATVVIAATSASAAATKPLSTTAAWPFSLRLSLVNLQSPSPEFSAVEGRDSLVGRGGVFHLNKSEATGLSGVPVGDDADAVHLSVRREQIAQFIFSGAMG
jgi:hypothetical protein